MLTALLLWIFVGLFSANLQMILPIILIAALIIYLAIPTYYMVTKERLHISGIYGLTIDMRAITSVELIEELPSVSLRTNGIGLGPIKKGFFIVEGLGRCRVLFNGNYSPYLIIRTNNGETIIINHKNKEYILSLASTIRSYDHKH